jgi:hypothetical protein
VARGAGRTSGASADSQRGTWEEREGHEDRMDIITIIQALLRRWYVAAPILAVGTAAAIALQVTTPPTYEAVGQVLLADPGLDPSGLPTTIVDLDEVLLELQSPELRDELQSGDATYQLDADDRTTATLVVRSSSESDALSTAQAVGAWLRGQVESIQAEAEIPPAERLQIRGSERIRATLDEATGSAEALTTITLFDPAAGITNPFAASVTTGRLLAVAVQSDEGRQNVFARTGPGISYLVAQSNNDAAPILAITTTGEDPAAVLGAFEAVREVVDEELQRRQERAEIPTSRRTRVETLAQPRNASDISPPLNRAAAAIFALGALLATAAAVATESVLARRRRQAQDVTWPMDPFHSPPGSPNGFTDNGSLLSRPPSSATSRPTPTETDRG